MSDEQQPKRALPTLPVNWVSGSKDPRTGERKTEIRSRASVIKEPSLADIATFADPNVKTCGSCANFRPPNKDRPEVRGFVARAIHEARWRMGYMGHTPENLSRCRQNSDLLVGVNSRSCDHYKPGNGGLR